MHLGTTDEQVILSKKLGCAQVMGAFLEGGSNEENALMKKVAVEQPAAPADLAELGSQGLSFASKL